MRILRPTSFFSVVAASTQHHYHYHYIYVNPTLLSFHLFTFFQPLKSNLPLFLLPPTSPSSSSIMSHFKGKYHGNSLPLSLSHALIYLVVIVSCLSGSQCFFFYLLFRLSLLCLFESIWIWICLWWFRSERFRSGFLWKTLWKKLVFDCLSMCSSRVFVQIINLVHEVSLSFLNSPWFNEIM